MQAPDFHSDTILSTATDQQPHLKDYEKEMHFLGLHLSY